jgi:MtN3 and saliva related transmembrane protein
MDMDWVKIVGYIAATATTISFLPQAIHSIKTRDTKGISLEMYLVFTFGLIMWLIYGISTKDVPIILANAVTLVLAVIILLYKLRYK